MLEFCRNAHWTGFVAEPTCIIRSYMAFKDAEIGICLNYHHRAITTVSNKKGWTYSKGTLIVALEKQEMVYTS
jgi:hypothetical protein